MRSPVAVEGNAEEFANARRAHRPLAVELGSPGSVRGREGMMGREKVAVDRLVQQDVPSGQTRGVELLDDVAGCAWFPGVPQAIVSVRSP